jgi:DNA-binding transcriptional LysR family regulator
VNISEFDLNLLVVFDALLLEKNVTRAARRLGVSQSALSKSLARLRAGIGDPLFERTRHGIAPTPRALAMAAPLRAALESVQAALLEPQRAIVARPCVRIAANRYAQALVLPQVAKMIAAMKDRITVSVVDTPADEPDVPLTIDWADARPPAGGRTAIVVRDTLACVRRRSPADKITKYTVESFTRAEHIAVGEDRAHDRVDFALAALGAWRRIGVHASDYVGAAWIAASTDFIATIPRRLAERLAPGLHLEVFRPPLDVDELALVVSWARRTADERPAMWLKERILEVGRDLGPKRES